jgi:hypothetical protein
MKKIHFVLFALLLSQYVVAQTETFDMATYTPPKEWKKDIKQGVVIYTNVNNVTGGYCVIAIYAGTPSTGDAQKDFKKEWENLVVTPYSADPNPKTETQTTADGWKAVTGAAAVKMDSLDAYVILTVFSGFGKTTSVLANLNDQAYLPLIDSLLENMKLDKTAAAQKNKTLSNQATTGAQKFGHMIYTPLINWKQQQYTNGVVLTPTDIPDDEYLEVRIMQNLPFPGNLQQALATTWGEALQQFILTARFDKPYAITKEKKSYKGWDYIKAEGVVKNDQGIEYKLYLFIIQLGNRTERIAILSLLKKRPDNGNAYFQTSYENPEYENAINAFLFSVKFDDRKEPEYVNGSLKGNGIVGMYAGLRMNAAAGASMEATYAVFFSNGQVYYRDKLPAEGFDGINTWVEAEWNIRNWGTYTLENGKGFLQLSNGSIPVRTNGHNLILTTQNTEHNYGKVAPVDGALFNGTYAFSGNWSDTYHPDRKAPSITFTADGKFIDQGALNVLHHTTMDPFDITKQPGSGTYQVKNFTLIFNYSDGRKVQIAFAGLNDDLKNQSPATLTLSFNNDELERQ